MKTAVYNEKIMATSSEKVAEHNKKFAALIELGMEDFWVQSETAAREESRGKERDELAAKENSKFVIAVDSVKRLNAYYASHFGLKPVTPYIYKDYGYCARGARGVRLYFNAGMTKERRYSYNAKGELNTASLRKALEAMYESLASKHRIELERQEKIKVAKSVISDELLERIGKVSRKSHKDLTPIALPDGKISITYEYWGQLRPSQKLTTCVFIPMRAEQWEKYVTIQENHEAALIALRDEITNI